MKILKYILFIIIGLTVAFFAAGLLKPSVSYGHEFKVDKPIEEAWAVSQDRTKFKQWLKGFESIELISGKQNEVGSKYKVVVKPSEDEDPFEMIQTLIDYKEFESVTLHFDSDIMNFEQTISYGNADKLTSVKSDSKVIGKNLMSRSLFAVMEMLTGSFSAQETENFENLKKLIEANTTDYYPTPINVEDVGPTEESDTTE
ncbi:MAG: hypothetical protein AAF502_24130 [Bacteroidota bacterium]